MHSQCNLCVLYQLGMFAALASCKKLVHRKETSRNKEIDGNRRKTRKGWMMEQIRRQRKETERMGIVIRHTEMVGNRRECHGKVGEQWRRS